MRINKNGQYALLFVMHLTKSGPARLKDVASDLNLSLCMLEQIARKLRLQGIVRSIRGPGGGYAVEGDPTALEVLQAMSISFGMSETDFVNLKSGTEIEQRSLFNLSIVLVNAMHKTLSIPLSSLVVNTTHNEVSQLLDLQVVAEHKKAI